MELTKEFIEQHGLSEEQVKGITSFGQDVIANKQKEWDGKANESAEKILTGAANYTLEKTGLKLERNQGEKYGDFIQRVSDTYLESKNNELSQLKSNYEEKLKDFKGGDALKSELDTVKKKYDDALQKYANYDELKDKAEKYDTTAQSLSKMKLEVAFGNVKPTFPDTVNKYEAKAKWEEFKSGVLEKYNIEIVDGIAKAIDKENQYKVVNLDDLVSKNETISKLSEGRKQAGTGAREAELETIEGVPFQLKANATSEERSTAIKEYLAKEGIDTMHRDYSQKFAELNKKILAKKNS